MSGGNKKWKRNQKGKTEDVPKHPGKRKWPTHQWSSYRKTQRKLPTSLTWVLECSRSVVFFSMFFSSWICQGKTEEDSRYIWWSFYFFMAVVAYIVLRRLKVFKMIYYGSLVGMALAFGSQSGKNRWVAGCVWNCGNVPEQLFIDHAKEQDVDGVCAPAEAFPLGCGRPAACWMRCSLPRMLSLALQSQWKARGENGSMQGSS